MTQATLASLAPIARELNKTLKEGKKLVVFQHDLSVGRNGDYNRHISVWIIHDGNALWNLADIIELTSAEKRMPSRADQFSTINVSSFMRGFLNCVRTYYPYVDFTDKELTDEEAEKYWRFVAA